MEENKPVGLKIKDVTEREPKEEVIEEVKEEETTEEVVDDPTVTISEDVFENDIIDNDFIATGYKIATARLVTDKGTTVYRFDIIYREFEKNNGLFEFKNIINNFNSIRPDQPKDFAGFIAVFGIIRWDFPSTIMPINTDPQSAIVKIESLINEHIALCNLKKGRFVFKIDIDIIDKE